MTATISINLPKQASTDLTKKSDSVLTNPADVAKHLPCNIFLL